MTTSSEINAMMSESSFFVLEDADGPYPCSCCSPQSAWDGDRWTCSHREWLLLESAPDFSLSHSSAVCEGRCGNPLHANFIFDKGELFGFGWGDIAQPVAVVVMVALSAGWLAVIRHRLHAGHSDSLRS